MLSYRRIIFHVLGLDLCSLNRVFSACAIVVLYFVQLQFTLVWTCR